MKFILLLSFAFLMSAAIVAPSPVEAAPNAALIAKCRAKYPESGTTQDRRRMGALRRQCYESGGKS